MTLIDGLRAKLTISAETGRPFDDIYGFDWDLADIGPADVLALVEIAEDADKAKAIIRHGWDDHMENFELMAEEDEEWLLKWAEKP